MRRTSSVFFLAGMPYCQLPSTEAVVVVQGNYTSYVPENVTGNAARTLQILLQGTGRATPARSMGIVP